MIQIPYSKADAALLPEWLAAAKRGDTAARNRVIVHTMRLAAKLVARYAQRVGRTDLADDMLQSVVAGRRNGGLLAAIEHFDPALGLTFVAYATRCILDACRGVLLGSGVVATRDVKARQVRARMLHRKLAAQLGREPSLDELAAALSTKAGVRRNRSEWLREAIEAPVVELSWEAITTPDEERTHGSARALSDAGRRSLLDPEQPTEDDLIAAIDGQRQRLALDAATLKRLSWYEREIVRAAYAQGWSDEQIAEANGDKRTTVRRVREHAISKLREALGVEAPAVALTPREAQIAERERLGMSAREISKALGLPLASVQSTRRRARRKLEAGATVA